MTATTVEQAPATPKSSFAAGMRVLPKAERDAMYRIYAFCRAVDDIADDQQGARPDRQVAPPRPIEQQRPYRVRGQDERK